MDIARAYTAFQSSATMDRVQMAVAKKALDAQRMEGAAAIQLLQSASIGTAQAGDELIAAATGLGGTIDAYG